MFEVVISRKVARKIETLTTHSKRVMEDIRFLRNNPLPLENFDIKKLKGFSYLYRIRIGKIRIIYHIDFEKKLVKIEEVDFRGKVYK